MKDDVLRKENIYVVGFPKSGNTWLVRLLARTLNVLVETSPMGSGDIEIASAVNKDIHASKAGRVYKVHWLPEQFQKEIDPSPKFLVYICRDPRDVFVSSFFYFSYFGEKRFVLRKAAWGLAEQLHHFVGRHKLSNYLQDFLSNGVGTLGTWGEHVQRWSAYLNQRGEEINCVFVRYEDLLADTAKELQRITSELDYPAKVSTPVSEVVELETFERLKNSSGEMFETLGAFNREFFRRFFREGRSGNWQDYLSKRQARRIESEFGQVISELGYGPTLLVR